MTRAAIINALIRLARTIGRWILNHIIESGITMLRGYMAGKVGDFRRRLKRAKTARRKRWLLGRIDRWETAIGWLGAHQLKIRDEITAEAYAMAGTIPMVAAAERGR